MLSKEEYIKLLNESYNDEEPTESLFDYSCSKGLEKLERLKNVKAIQKFLNITNYKNANEALKDCLNNSLYVGKFLIKINGPTKTNTYHMEIRQLATKTLSGLPCEIYNIVNTNKDGRFTNRSWNSYFFQGKGTNIPADIVPTIIKYLQFIDKFPIMA